MKNFNILIFASVLAFNSFSSAATSNSTSHLQIKKISCKTTAEKDEYGRRIILGSVETGYDLGGAKYKLEIRGSDGDNTNVLCEMLDLFKAKGTYISLAISNQAEVPNTDKYTGKLDAVIIEAFND